MFPNIMMDPAPKQLYRILWQEGQHYKLKSYHINVILFRMESASFMATLVLIYIALNDPLIMKLKIVFTKNFYMDD
jgi:hypothetical protein